MTVSDRAGIPVGLFVDNATPNKITLVEER